MTVPCMNPPRLPFPPSVIPPSVRESCERVAELEKVQSPFTQSELKLHEADLVELAL
jgi:hypothetical protein